MSRCIDWVNRVEVLFYLRKPCHYRLAELIGPCEVADSGLYLMRTME
jgi:hypothetical protein